MRFTKELSINAAPEKVFAYVADLTRHPEWANHKLKIEASSDAPLGVGSKFNSVGHQMGMESHDEVTVVTYEPLQRFAYEAKSKDGRFRHLIELRPDGSATRVTKSMEVVEASLGTKLMTPLIFLMAPGVLSKDLRRIKARLEQ